MKLNYLQKEIMKSLRVNKFISATELSAKCGLTTRDLRDEIKVLRPHFPIIADARGYKLTHNKKEIKEAHLLWDAFAKSCQKTANCYRRHL